MTKSGVPDILSCVNGFFVGIEVKASNGHPSELQKYNVNKINDSGGFAVILYPQDYGLFKELVKCLNDYDYVEASKVCKQINERSMKNG